MSKYGSHGNEMSQQIITRWRMDGVCLDVKRLRIRRHFPAKVDLISST